MTSKVWASFFFPSDWADFSLHLFFLTQQDAVSSRSSRGAPRNLCQVRVFTLFISFPLCCAVHPSERKGLPLIFLVNISCSVLQHIGRQHSCHQDIKEASEFSSMVSNKRCRQEFNGAADVWLPSRHKHFCSRSQSRAWAPERAGVQMHLSHSMWRYFRFFELDACPTQCPWWGISGHLALGSNFYPECQPLWSEVLQHVTPKHLNCLGRSRLIKIAIIITIISGSLLLHFRDPASKTSF